MTITPAVLFGSAGSTCDEQLTDTEYDLASRILDALVARGDGRDHSPSQLARLAGVRASVGEVRAVLWALVADAHLVSTERGAWSRYRLIAA